MRAMMALMLHLGGVGEFVRLIWEWSVHNQESGDLQYYSTILQYNNTVLQYHTYPEWSIYLMYLVRFFTLLTPGQGEQMFFCSSELSPSHQNNLIQESHLHPTIMHTLNLSS